MCFAPPTKEKLVTTFEIMQLAKHPVVLYRSIEGINQTLHFRNELNIRGKVVVEGQFFKVFTGNGNRLRATLSHSQVKEFFDALETLMNLLPYQHSEKEIYEIEMEIQDAKSKLEYAPYIPGNGCLASWELDTVDDYA